MLLRRKPTATSRPSPAPLIPYIRFHGSENDDTSHPAYQAGLARGKKNPSGEIATGSIGRAVAWAKPYLAYIGLSVPPPSIPYADQPFVAFAPVNPSDWSVGANLPHHIPTVEEASLRALEFARNLIALRLQFHSQLKVVEGKGTLGKVLPAEFLLANSTNQSFLEELKDQLSITTEGPITNDNLPSDMWLALRPSELKDGKLGPGDSIVITGAFQNNGFGKELKLVNLKTKGFESYADRVLVRATPAALQRFSG